MDQFVSHHPLLSTALAFFVGTLPQWLSGTWGLFSKEPLFPYLSRRYGMALSEGWKPYIVTAPIGLLMFGYVLYSLDHTKEQSQSPVVIQKGTVQGNEPLFTGGLDSVEDLRKLYHLRLIRDVEEGKLISALPTGVYGFGRCDLATSMLGEAWLYLGPSGSQIFEFQKRHDLTVYLVGYASQEHAGKLQSSKTSFDMTLFNEKLEDGSELVSIPIRKMTSCQTQPFRRRYRLDLTIKGSED